MNTERGMFDGLSESRILGYMLPAGRASYRAASKTTFAEFWTAIAGSASPDDVVAANDLYDYQVQTWLDSAIGAACPLGWATLPKAWNVHRATALASLCDAALAYENRVAQSA